MDQEYFSRPVHSSSWKALTRISPLTSGLESDPHASRQGEEEEDKKKDEEEGDWEEEGEEKEAEEEEKID